MAKHVKGSAIANASSYKLYLANGTELATQSTNVSAGIDFDLSTIAALKAAGTYSLGVKAISGDTTKFLDSLMSNLVSYTVATPVTPPGENIAYYIVNKNLWSDGEIQDYAGRITITTYFPTNGKELSVSTSIPGVTTIAKRYYNAEKVGGASATESTYGRVVLVLGTTTLKDIYANQTITVNGTVYTLQPDPAYLPDKVTYVTKANIGADGVIVENYSEFRVAVLDYFETGGAAITASSSLGGTAIRYYDADKNGGATAATSTYARIVIHSISADNQNDAAVEGSTITVNGIAYTLSNN